MEKQDPQLQQLLGAVQDLSAAVDNYEQRLRDNVAATARVGQLAEQSRTTSRRTRIGLMITALSVIIDLTLTGVIFYQNERQSCFNTRSSQFFDVEKTKVQGQISGKREERDAVEALLNRTTDPKTALAQFSRGTNDWIAASNTYLDKIATIRTKGC